MKKTVLLLVGAVMSATLSAQIVEKNEAALVYYSPKTTVNIDFMYTVETHEPGIYSAYAAELMGVTEDVEEARTTYTLDKVQIGTSTTADYSRPHKVRFDAGIAPYLRINEKQLLVGYNTPEVEEPCAAKKATDSKKVGERSRITSIKTAPYEEAIQKAGDTAERAHVAASQIFRIRETRMYLLSGEVEHSPADGGSMKAVLDELEKEEQALLSLFTGQTTVNKGCKHISLEPTAEPVWVLFSQENGFCKDSVEADTIAIQMTLHGQVYVEREEEVDAKGRKKVVEEPALSPIVYNLPGSCDIEVVYNGEKMASRTIQVAQLGVDVALPQELFTGKELPVIEFNEKTGNIISISK